MSNNLTKLVCPESVVYFGANILYNDHIDLTIKFKDSSLMLVEPNALYFMELNSKITFAGITEPTELTNCSIAFGDGTYHYYSHSYVERDCYKEGVWCEHYFHITIPITFLEEN